MLRNVCCRHPEAEGCECGGGGHQRWGDRKVSGYEQKWTPLWSSELCFFIYIYILQFDLKMNFGWKGWTLTDCNKCSLVPFVFLCNSFNSFFIKSHNCSFISQRKFKLADRYSFVTGCAKQPRLQNSGKFQCS